MNTQLTESQSRKLDAILGLLNLKYGPGATAVVTAKQITIKSADGYFFKWMKVKKGARGWTASVFNRIIEKNASLDDALVELMGHALDL